MRSFRTLGATALATASGLALLGTAVTGSGTAAAAPASASYLYAPSALVLTLGKGEGTTATVVRAVTLSCAPTPSGTHPAPAEACRELGEAHGDFAHLGGDTATSRHILCTREWDPVTVTGDGVWEGKRVHWSARYGNACELRAATGEGTVFAF